MYTFSMAPALFALLSAFFAALTAILAKIGIKNIDSNLATAIRTVVILFFAWAIVFFQKSAKQLSSVSSHTLFFLVLSGITTGLSWLFYFKALQMGKASQVVAIDKLSLVMAILLAAIIFKEKITLASVAGMAMMVLGAILISTAK